MTYKTIIFDANRPIVKQITEPLNSDYGVAVKVYKDDELLNCELSVGGEKLEDGRNGWKTYQLSSGSEPCMKTLDVLVEQSASTHYGMTKTGSYTNPIPMPASSKLLSASLSEAGVEDTIQLNASDVKMLSGWMAGQAQSDVRLYPVDNTASYVLSGETWINRQTPSETLDSLEVTPDSYIALWGNAPAQQPVEVRLVFEADVAGKASYNFKLQVQEQDMGYFNEEQVEQTNEDE